MDAPTFTLGLACPDSASGPPPTLGPGLAYSRPPGSGGARKNSPKTRAGDWESSMGPRVGPQDHLVLCLGRCCLTLPPSAEGLGGSGIRPQRPKWVGRDLVPDPPCHSRAQESPSALAHPQALGRMSACVPHGEDATPNCLGSQPRRPAREGPPHTHLNPTESSVHPPSAVWQDLGCTQPG